MQLARGIIPPQNPCVPHMPGSARAMFLRFVGMRVSRQAYITVDFLKTQTGNKKRKEFMNIVCNINHAIHNIKEIYLLKTCTG